MSAVYTYLKLSVDAAITASADGNLKDFEEQMDILNQFTPAWINYVQALNEDENDSAQSLYDFIMNLLNVPSGDADRNLTITEQKTNFAYK